MSGEQSLSGTQGVLQGGLPGCGHSPGGVQEPPVSGGRGGLGAGGGGWELTGPQPPASSCAQSRLTLVTELRLNRGWRTGETGSKRAYFVNKFF